MLLVGLLLLNTTDTITKYYWNFWHLLFMILQLFNHYPLYLLISSIFINFESFKIKLNSINNTAVLKIELTLKLRTSNYSIRCTNNFNYIIA